MSIFRKDNAVQNIYLTVKLTAIIGRANKKHFCSILFSFLNSWKSQCLREKPQTENNVQNLKKCGNNVLDEGEECDCGIAEFCTNPCCDPYTCKLTENSECFEGGCCKNCKLKKQGTVCREAGDDCDLPDSCDGKSQECPDRYKEDGTSCVFNGLCLKGKCKSRTVQCERVFGKGTMNGPASA